jgi:hypothetical protein
MKIYVASSWRNTYQPGVVAKLRDLGHEVYDFRGPRDGWSSGEEEGGFSWRTIDPNWQNWTPEEYIEALAHPLALEGFKRDMDALLRCDACLMVMPCGPSASMEMGWAKGAGKLVCVYAPEIREPDLMVKMADQVTSRWKYVDTWLRVAIQVMNVFGRWNEE